MSKDFREQKPSIVTKQKPVRTEDLFKYVTEEVQKEPNIISQPEQLLVGFETEIPSPFGTTENICDHISRAWPKLFEFPKAKENSLFYGITISPSGDFTEATVLYFAGLPVSNDFKPIDGMSEYRIPAHKVAVFDILSPIEKDVAALTVDYIYGYWLPNSFYDRAKGMDFEIFEGTIDFENPNFTEKYAIPIVSKK